MDVPCKAAAMVVTFGLSAAATIVLCAAAAVASTGLAAGVSGITSTYARPPPAMPLRHEEILQHLDSLEAGTGPSRRLSSEVAEVAVDPVEQVHLGLGGPGEVVVTWATWLRGLPSKVLFSEEDGVWREATGQASAYVIQLCPNKHLAEPRLRGAGARPQISDEEVAQLVNTSRLGLPRDSAAYRLIEDASESWAVLEHDQWCLRYSNPLAYYESPYIHTVVLTGLKSRATYRYRPEGGQRTFGFTMPQAVGLSDPEKPLKIGVWGDVGITDVSFAVMQELARRKSEVALLVGDYSYADGWGPKWESFGMMMEPLMARVPGLGVAGNHEIASGRQQGLDWLHRYPQPYRQSGSESPHYWSYETGLVHILGLPGSYAPSANSTGGHPSAQYLFAAEDLARVDRRRTPWVVVMFHTPWYTSNEYHFQEGIKHQWDMEDLFFRYGVDVVLGGHVHAYERSHPVYRNEVNACGVVHIVTGDAGNYEGPASRWREPQPTWSAFREASFGAGGLTFHNATHAEWEWVRTACVSKGAEKKGTYLWDRQLGSEDCHADSNGSSAAYAAVDTTFIIRDTLACTNRESTAPLRRWPYTTNR
mmetsp:Transcript_145212/g.362208  ORF Transcript_145212/g.362208 Transcript_145212/m.362208 type:complete len:591 (+) Transcript_145212:92-1864(+)